MRFLFSSAFVIAAFALAASCVDHTSPPGELMVQVTTDMSLPKDIDHVRVQILSNGRTVNDQSYEVGQGQLLIPATIGILAGGDPSATAIVRVTAIHNGQALLLREATSQVPGDRVATLQMPLQFLCEGSAVDMPPAGSAPDPTIDAITEMACPAGQTCVAGTCTDATATLADLPTFEASGGGADAAASSSTCFDTTSCFAGAAPLNLQASGCTATLPAGIDPASLNVALQTTDGQGICGGPLGTTPPCFVPLDDDPASGWQLQGTTIQVPPGVCNELVNGLKASVVVSGACPSKTPAVATCGPWSSAGTGAKDAGAASEAGAELLKGATSLTGGAGFNCAVVAGGAVDCWGLSAASLVLGSSAANTFRPAPVPIGGLTGATQVAGGNDFTCALLSGGSVSCWGDNSEGELGANGAASTSMTPVAIAGLSGVRAIAAGDEFACALLSIGTVSCWGYDDYGQLGDGGRDGGILSNSPTPVTVPGLVGVTAIAAGEEFACAVVSGGAVECWGAIPSTNTYSDASAAPSVAGPTPVAGISGATAVAGGNAFACALLSGGAVDCWGSNVYGQLGNGTTVGTSSPVPVTGLSGATAIGAGEASACALLSGGSVACWGDDAFGELGNGSNAGSSSTPVAVSGLSGVTALADNYLGACALVAEGGVECWGDNALGELGNGAITSSFTPVAVPNLQGVTAIASGSSGDDFTCALLQGGTVDCWGTGNEGELGNGQPVSTPADTTGYYFFNQSTSTPAPVVGLSNVIAVGAGYQTACAVVAVGSQQSGSVECWGGDPYGDGGGVTYSSTPVAIPGATGVTAVAVGSEFACALLAAGTVECWGQDAVGELGSGSQTLSGSSSPVAVSGLSGVTAIAAGSEYACALLANGTVECWGLNFEIVDPDSGIATGQPQYAPVAVPGIAGATAIAAGDQFACAVVSGGAVECWGANVEGELGDGTMTSSGQPVRVAGVSGATAVAAGEISACALLQGGTVECWGDDSWGELGNGATASSTTPVAVEGLSGVRAVASGFTARCALLSGGTVDCWGLNVGGELGRSRGSSTPEAVLAATSVAASSGSGTGSSASNGNSSGSGADSGTTTARDAGGIDASADAGTVRQLPTDAGGRVLPDAAP